MMLTGKEKFPEQDFSNEIKILSWIKAQLEFNSSPLHTLYFFFI